MLNALAATWYPTDLRSTGIGAALGVGRFGAILGPLVASVLVARGWPMEGLFGVAAVPALLAMVAALALHWVLGERGRAPFPYRRERAPPPGDGRAARGARSV
jgi:AAHS family 4-hydroxybenzoate transporter-like MFS transporter